MKQLIDDFFKLNKKLRFSCLLLKIKKKKKRKGGEKGWYGKRLEDDKKEGKV